MGKILSYEDMIKLEDKLSKEVNGQDYWKVLVLGLIVNLLGQRR